MLEHIEDDEAVLRHCARLLKHGAWCVAFVPAGQWLYSTFDRNIGHFRRYGAKDRSRLDSIESEGARLALREFRHVNLPGAFGWYIKMRLLGATSVNRRDAAIVGRLLPVIEAIDRLRLPFGQSAVMIWQRCA